MSGCQHDYQRAESERFAARVEADRRFAEMLPTPEHFTVDAGTFHAITRLTSAGRVFVTDDRRLSVTVRDEATGGGRTYYCDDADAVDRHIERLTDFATGRE